MIKKWPIGEKSFDTIEWKKMMADGVVMPKDVEDIMDMFETKS